MLVKNRQILEKIADIVESFGLSALIGRTVETYSGGQRRRLEIARSLREQIDWNDVEARTRQSPFARAFFTLGEGLGIIERRRALSPAHVS